MDKTLIILCLIPLSFWTKWNMFTVHNKPVHCHHWFIHYWMWIILIDEDRGRRHDAGRSSILTNYYNLSYFNHFDISFVYFDFSFVYFDLFSFFSSTTVCSVCSYVQQWNVGSLKTIQCVLFECFTHVLVVVNFTCTHIYVTRRFYTYVFVSQHLHMYLLLGSFALYCYSSFIY